MRTVSRRKATRTVRSYTGRLAIKYARKIKKLNRRMAGKKHKRRRRNSPAQSLQPLLLNGLQHYLADQSDDEEYGPQADFDDQDGAAPQLDIPIEWLGFLSPDKRKQLKQKFPNIPDYFFLSPDQKETYFFNKSKEYITRLKSQKKTLQHTHGRKVKFANTVQFKEFNEQQTPVAVRKAVAKTRNHLPTSTRRF